MIIVKKFTFADKALITLTFILHKTPPNKKTSQEWFFKGGGLIGNDVERQSAWVKKHGKLSGGGRYKRGEMFEDSSKCKDCTEYFFNYELEELTGFSMNNACGNGCNPRLDKIVRKIEEKNEENIKQLEKDIEENRISKITITNQFRGSEWLSPLPFFPLKKPTKKELKKIQGLDEEFEKYKENLNAVKFDKKTIALLCCDRNVKAEDAADEKDMYDKREWKCPSGTTKGPSYIQRSFYYYIRQVFGEFTWNNPLMSEKISIASYIPERYIEGAEELMDL